jgi:S1-C subfamily serine protease
LNDGRVVPAHPLAYDQVTGFGLVQALARLDVPALPMGRAAAAQPGSPVVMAAGGGREHALASFIVGRQEFAGYWEYLLDEAIFTAPAHPLWGGAALIGPGGDLLGIGSLQVEQKAEGGQEAHLNMSVPIDLLPPILDDLLTTGRASRAARPWLGLFATELEGKVFAVGLSTRGPAQRGDLRPGRHDRCRSGPKKVTTLAEFYRAVWSLGPAGVGSSARRWSATAAPSSCGSRPPDRERFLKAPAHALMRGYARLLSRASKPRTRSESDSVIAR